MYYILSIIMTLFKNFNVYAFLIFFKDQLFPENEESCDSNQVDILILNPTVDFQKVIKKLPG